MNFRVTHVLAMRCSRSHQMADSPWPGASPITSGFKSCPETPATDVASVEVNHDVCLSVFI